MDALLLAVLNALWQGAALIALVALALRFGLRRNATTACVVWSITFLVVALLPALDLALARPATARPAPARPVPAAALAAPLPESPLAAAVAFVPAPAPEPARIDVVAAAGASFAERIRDGALRLGGTVTAFARVWGIVLLGGWAVVAGALLLRLARGYGAVARMKRDAVPLDDPVVLARLRAAGHRRRATVARSLSVDVPCAVGFRRPMILIPERLAASLDVDDLARVVLHESAHLQRYDDWLNALEQVVCALQFFQPALHVARRGIDFEREVACDDRVLEDAGEPLRYAECLARIVQRSARTRRVAVAPGFVLRRPQVVARVRRIVDRSRDASPHLRFAAVTSTAVVLAATLGIARLQVPVVAAAAASTPVDAAHPAAPAAAPRAVVASKPRAAHAACRDGRRHGATAAAVRVRALPAAPRAPAAATDVVTVTAPQITVGALPTDFIAPAAVVRVAPVVVAHVRVAPLPVVREATVTRVRTAPVAVVRTTSSVDAIAPTAVAFVAESAARVAPVAVRAVQTTVTVSAPRAVEGASTPVVPRRETDLLDAIDEAKYGHPSVDELIALRNQGVSGDYIRRMGALGRARPALRDLLALANQGVTPEYVGVLDRRLASTPSFNQILALRSQGVSGRWLDGLAAIGYPKLAVDDAIALAVQGISATYVRGLLDAGLRNVTPQQVVALHVQGIDGSFVRRLAAHGYNNLSIDELVRLKVSGFQP